jgi:hypothetical protein
MAIGNRHVQCMLMLSKDSKDYAMLLLCATPNGKATRTLVFKFEKCQVFW